MMTNSSISHSVSFTLILIGLLSGAAGGSDGNAQSPTNLRELKTVAEQTSFQGTSDEFQVRDFLDQIDMASDLVSRVKLGVTTEGRPLDAVIFSKDGGNPLPLPISDKRLVILIHGNIHSGECDGKEAILALMRDWLLDPVELAQTLEKTVLVILPNFNADGNARVGKLHRPGQAGPDFGMGVRENPFGLDLNRDFMKLDSSEVRSLVRAIDALDVDVLIDAHTTNGSLHQYDLTYDLPHNPAANPTIISWMRKEFFPTITMDLAKQNTPIFYYGNFSRDHKSWESYGHEPRYSTEYMGVRGKIGILVESYSYATYQRRVEASYQFIDACVTHLAKNSDKLANWLVPAPSRRDSIPIQAKIVTEPGTFLAKGYSWKDSVKENESRAPFPSPRDKDRLDQLNKVDYEVALVNRGEGVVHVAAPTYYYIPFDAAWAASRLRLHGVRMSEISSSEAQKHSAQSLSATAYRIQSITKLAPYQMHTPQKIEVKEEALSWKMQPGWVVNTDQPLAVLVSHLLEPHADDSLAAWNFFDPALQPNSLYPVLRLNALPNGTVLKPLPPLSIDDHSPSDVKREELTIEKLYDPNSKISFVGAGTPLPRWLPGKSEYVQQQQGRWFSIDCKTGAMAPWDLPSRMASALLKLNAFEEKDVARFRTSISAFDPTLEYAVVNHKNDLYLFQSQGNAVRQLTHDTDAAETVPTLSPDGKYVAFVRDNNIWVVNCESTEVRQMTKDGAPEILNGYLDWVYQEEVYGRGNFKAYWWSPDGKKIAFLKLDESPVPNFVINDSISFEQKIENIRYPKAGQPNPFVSLHVLDVETGAIDEVPLPDYPADDRLIVRVGWSTTQSSEMIYQVQNRIQSRLDVCSFDVSSKQNHRWAREESNAWIDVIDAPRFVSADQFLWVSDADAGRRHLFFVQRNGERKQLTKGDWDVKDVAWMAADGSRVVFTAHKSSPANTDLLVLDTVTGDIQPIETRPGVVNASVHPSGEYLAQSWSNTENPPEMWLRDRAGNKLRRLDSLQSDRFDYVKSSPPEQFTVTARDGFAMQTMIYKPTDFEVGKTTKKYPVLIHVYAGPQSPTVQNAWIRRSDLWHRFLAEQGIVVMLCDNRSSLGRGSADTWTIYKNLGAVELRDLEDAVGWLKGQSWADTDRLGIWGWSYGGYFTGYAMTHSKLFRAGISGAPVTDWRNYDSIYTERYMSTPQLNPEGYRTSSVVEAAKDLHGRLLLIHGEIDENVHMTNTLQLVQALQQANKSFDLMIYPSNRHGVTDPKQQFHMYQMMTNFLKRELVTP